MSAQVESITKSKQLLTDEHGIDRTCLHVDTTPQASEEEALASS